MTNEKKFLRIIPFVWSFDSLFDIIKTDQKFISEGKHSGMYIVHVSK